jgi:anti-sigma B factor antagonist
VSLLEITVETGTSGTVMKLSGECDLTTTGQLSDALGAQIATGVQHLTIDLSALRFADSMTIREFIEAHHALKTAGGTLELLRPQPAVAKSLRLLGVDQILTVRDKTGTGDQPMIP